MPRTFHALPVALALAAGACGLSTAAFAQSAPTAPSTPPATAQPVSPAITDTGADKATDSGTVRLTDAQRDAILDANTEARAAAARGELSGSDGVDRRIHGEVGVMIGTNGTRGAYGTADIPLGENAGASVSFETSRYGDRRWRRSPR